METIEGSPTSLPHGFLVSLRRPRRLLLLARQDGPVDGHVLEDLALQAAAEIGTFSTNLKI